VKHREAYLFIRKGDRECEEARRFLEKTGLSFKALSVEDKDRRAFLWKDLATDDVPVLAVDDMILFGLTPIKDYLSREIKS